MFEAGKYGLALALFILSAIIVLANRGRTRRIDRDALILLILTGGFATYCFALGVTFLQGTATEGAYRVIRGYFFFPLLALVPFHFRGWSSLRKYFAIVVIFGCAYHIGYSAIQILAFELFGRLPSLAFPGGLVRFGGGWDDPNGFGGFVVLPLLFLISDAFLLSKRKRVLIGAVLAPLLVLTVSVAAAASMVGALVCYVALRRKWWLLIGLAAVVALPLLSSTVRDLLMFAYQAKEASVESHFVSMSLGDFFSQSSMIEVLFGRHGANASISESYYVALAEDFGCVGAIWFLTIIGLTLVNALRKARALGLANDHKGAETFRVLASFIAGLSFASVGIAYYLVFPVNLYLWLAIFAVWLTRGGATSLECVGAPAYPLDGREPAMVTINDATCVPVR